MSTNFFTRQYINPLSPMRCYSPFCILRLFEALPDSLCGRVGDFVRGGGCGHFPCGAFGFPVSATNPSFLPV